MFLDIFPGLRFLAQDYVVTQPAAALYAQGASQRAVFAAANAETDKRRAFELFRDGTSFELLPLAGQSFGRLCLGAARCVSDLSEAGASDRCVSKIAFVRTRLEPSSTLCWENLRM